MARRPLHYVLICLQIWLMVLLAAGCESHRYGAARGENTVDAYLRFLAAYPEGELADDARRRVERLRYWEARRVDRPLGYTTYLERYPQGTYAAASRKRLAQLALGRASSAADLELIVERYPGSDASAAARRRLPRLLAREALASKDPALAARFLARFGGDEQAAPVREHLADLRYADLPGQVVELEAFLDRFGGTSAGRRALARLEQLLAEIVRETRDSRELERFRARFPRSKALPELEQLVRQEQLLRALAAVDEAALARLTDAPRAVALSKWCKKVPRRCADLRELAARAAPWKPSVPLEALRRQTYAADPQQAWSAMARLAWIPQTSVGDLLLELVGSERLSTVWAARPALKRWLDNLPPAARRRWMASRLGRAHHAANPDEVQRRAQLRLLASRDSSQGLADLRRITAGAVHVLPAAYLLTHWEAKGRGVERATLVRFTSSARARLKWLRDAFPGEMNPDNRFSATLAERELFALIRAAGEVRRAAGKVSAAGLDELVQEAQGLLVEWHRRVAGHKDVTFPFAEVPDFADEVRRHEQGRAAALRALAGFGKAGHLVAEGLCRRPAVAPPGCATRSTR